MREHIDAGVKAGWISFPVAALQGMLTDPQREGLADDYAKHAYLCADAMLKARKAKL